MRLRYFTIAILLYRYPMTIQYFPVMIYQFKDIAFNDPSFDLNVIIIVTFGLNFLLNINMNNCFFNKDP